MNNKPEYRSIAGSPALDLAGNTIEGYAVHWNVRSTEPKVMVRNGKKFAFWEKIAPYAFKQSLAEGMDVGCYFDHETSKILGRLRAKTLDVHEDEKGLYYRCPLPETSYASDLKVSIHRGDIYGNSFGMFVGVDSWDKAEDGLPERTIVTGILFDVSPVSQPTYEDTEVALRSLDRAGSALETILEEVAQPWVDRLWFRLRMLERGL